VKGSPTDGSARSWPNCSRCQSPSSVSTRQRKTIWRVGNGKVVRWASRGVSSNGCWFAPSGDSGKPAGAPHPFSLRRLLDHHLTQEDRRTLIRLRARLNDTIPDEKRIRIRNRLTRPVCSNLGTSPASLANTRKWTSRACEVADELSTIRQTEATRPDTGHARTSCHPAVAHRRRACSGRRAYAAWR
jgi:hypothetical protein